MKVSLRAKEPLHADKRTGILQNTSWPLRVLLLLTVLQPFVVAGWFAWHQHQAVITEVEDSAQRSVVALVEHADNVMQLHNLVLRQVASAVDGRSGPDIAADKALLQMFADLTAQYEQVSVLAVTDADGRVLASSLKVPPAESSIADRDYFLAHKNGTIRGVYFSEAFTGRISGQRRFAISLARRTADGKFDGIVFTAISLEYFTRFWKQFAPSHGYLIPMIRDDGTLIVRYPALQNPERLNPNGPFLTHIRSAPRGIYTATSQVDGIERINAYSQIKNYPLYVSFSIEKDVALHQWRRDVVIVAVVATIITIALVTLLLLVIRQSQRQRRAVARWREIADNLEREVRRREEAEEALRQGQKMEAIGQLTGGIAHDFNNLLAGISGNLELMRIRLNQGLVMDIGRYIDAAESVLDKATALTRRLLAFSRRQPQSPMPTSVNERIATMQELIGRTVGPSVELSVELGPDAGCTVCDQNELDSALLNLAINARDAMPKGGRLTVTTKNARISDEDEARALGVACGEYVTLSVADTGTGMSPEVVQRAFDPFFTTKPIGHGTGLGLSMVYGFVKQSGGGIKISSVVDVGTVVRIFLPLSAAGSSAQPAGPKPPAQWLPAKGTIMLVDDEAPLRNLLTEVLGDIGYRVVPSVDGPSALDVLKASGAVELLVTDVGLPGSMNGKQLAQAARRIHPGLKVMFITGFVDDVRGEADGPNCDAYVLFKPFRLDEFTRRVAETLRAGN